MREPLGFGGIGAMPKATKVTGVTASQDITGWYFVSLLCDDVVTKKSEV